MRRFVVLSWVLTLSALSGSALAEEPKKSETKSSEPQPAPAPEVKREATTAEGEKSYQFGAVEVEGRLKAPQILYFVRRVRAELQRGQLGHRSFLPELRDTRRSEALR